MHNFNHFYYFFVTAKLGGVSNAAKYLRISQPSLSTQLKILEASLEKKLFEKRGRGISLTLEGEKIFAFSKKMFQVAEEMDEFLKSPSLLTHSKIKIGVSDQLERPFVADILSPMLKDREVTEKNTFIITSEPDNGLISTLRSQEVDLVLTSRPIYGEDLAELAAISMPVRLMISTENMKNLRVKISRQTTVSEFMQMIPWGIVLPAENIKLRQETDMFLQEMKTRKHIVFESDILSVVARAIQDGAGFGFLPVPYVHEEIRLNLLSPFGPKQGYWKHMLYLIARKQDHYGAAIEQVISCVKAVERMN